MPKYEVLVPELHYQTVIIEAESEIDALQKVIDFDGDRVDGGLEHSCVMDEYLDHALADLQAGDNNYDWMIQEAKND